MINRYLMRSRLAFTYFIRISIIAIGASILFSCTKISLAPNPVVVVPTPPDLAGQPNIILILADDIGYEVPTFDGGQSYNTPNLDRMAADGLRFTNCFASALSSPSRFMLTTGKYNFRNYSKWGVMNPSEITLANILHNAGYATCVAGKWQFDGGNVSLTSFGYDRYCVWDAFAAGKEEEAELGTSYKDPTIYQNGAYLGTDSVLTGSYGVDVFNQYVMNFIDSNKTRPFFIYYPIPLAHAPFSPTPDDAQYAGWVNGSSDTAFYRSMVSYLDKAVNAVVEKVKSAGLEKNTVILFLSDNGTPSQIVSTYNDQRIRGGMGSTNTFGTHVPLLAYCPGSIPYGSCSAFVELTDFIPTLTELANTLLPAGSITDGISFRNQLFRPSLANRSYAYNFFSPHPDYAASLQRQYVHDDQYKYYDNGYGFFNIANDPAELNSLEGTVATDEQQRFVQRSRKIIDSIHP